MQSSSWILLPSTLHQLCSSLSSPLVFSHSLSHLGFSYSLTQTKEKLMANTQKKMFSNGSTSAEVIIRGLQNVSLEEKKEEKIESGFQYPLRPYEPDCVFFMKHGICRYGSACMFNHPIDRMVKSRSYSRLCKVAEDIPGRAAKKGCKYYSSPGGCRNGNSCRFAHYTERTDIRQMAPNPTDSPVQPNVKLTHAPAMAKENDSMDLKVNAEKHPESGVQFNQPNGHPTETVEVSVTPIWLPMKHSLVETSSSLSRRNVKCVSAPSPTMSEERDTDDEGSDYDEKYDEESERQLAELASVPVGPTGLPLRPERPICIYYSRYGLCCYGPGCPDDHTLDRVLAQRTRGNESP